MPAAAAVLGVVGVLELGQRLARVLDAEVGDPGAALEPPSRPRSATSGSSALRQKPVPPARSATRLGPFVGEQLELAVAVELVAEEIAEHDLARVELARDPGQPCLVDLEQALLAALLEQRRGDAAVHVRSGAVVHRRAARRPQGGGDHRRRRRLPVGGADDGRATVKPGAEARDRVGRHPQEQPPRQGRAAAAPAAPAERSGRPREPDLGAESRRPLRAPRSALSAGTITRRARGQQPHRRRQVGEVVAVGVDRERPVGVHPYLLRPPHPHLERLLVLALEHLRRCPGESGAWRRRR